MSKWNFEPARDILLPEEERFRSVRREPGLISFASHAFFGTLLRTGFRLWHRLGVIGSEHLPASTPFIVSANHASHMDALILAAALPLRVRLDTYPIAAGDVFFTNALSSVLSSLVINALPLHRKKASGHALKDLRERLAKGHSGFILFPEGARTRDGKPLPYKPGLGMLVASTPVPVVPCYLDGCFEALKPGQMIPRPRRITVRVAPPLRFDTTPDTREGWDQVSKSVRDAIYSVAPPNAQRP